MGMIWNRIGVVGVLVSIAVVACSSQGPLDVRTESDRTLRPEISRQTKGAKLPVEESGPKLCLTPHAQRAWHDRRISLQADEGTLTRRAFEVQAREVLLPLTGRLNIIASGLQSIGNAAGLVEPLCGNWCGAARRYRGDDPPAIDELDSACKAHEVCTVSKRLGVSGKGASCECDQQLADEILRGRNLVSLSENEKRVVMFLQGQPCGGGCKRIENVQACGR